MCSVLIYVQCVNFRGGTSRFLRAEIDLCNVLKAEICYVPLPIRQLVGPRPNAFLCFLSFLSATSLRPIIYSSKVSSSRRGSFFRFLSGPLSSPLRSIKPTMNPLFSWQTYSLLNFESPYASSIIRSIRLFSYLIT